MERGDLHQWLHELPAGSPSDTDNFIGDDDSFEPHQPTTYTKRTTAAEWPTRHKIALGIARGLAFLHQGWAGPGSSQPIVHGRLVPSNVLLDEYLDPRISDFTSGGGGGETTESNVYSFGVLVMELVTGRGKWSSEEVEKVRKSVRDGKGFKEVDSRMKDVGNERHWEKEMVECLRVGYLCTAQAPDKRLTMQQVVGLLKDTRQSSASSGASSSFSGQMINPK